MNQLITRIRGQLGQLNERLSGATKLAIGLILGLAVLLGIFIAYDASKEEFEALPAEYTAEQMTQVQRILTEQSIPYQTPGAGVIMVPSAQHDNVMNNLASEGVSGEITHGLGKMSTSMSAKAQAEYLRRHQEEVLAHVIAALDPVWRAKVSLSMPRESVFLKETRPASASVMVTLKPGQSLGKGQVQGIIHLVSGGVSGLNPDNVVIVDQNSNILSENKDGPSAAREISSLFATARRLA